MPLWAPWAVLLENQQPSIRLNMIGICLIHCNHSCTFLVSSLSWWHNTSISLSVMNVLDMNVDQIKFLCVWVVNSWVYHELLCQEFNNSQKGSIWSVSCDCWSIMPFCELWLYGYKLFLCQWMSNELVYPNECLMSYFTRCRLWGRGWTIASCVAAHI